MERVHKQNKIIKQIKYNQNTKSTNTHTNTKYLQKQQISAKQNKKQQQQTYKLEIANAIKKKTVKEQQLTNTNKPQRKLEPHKFKNNKKQYLNTTNTEKHKIKTQ